MSALPLALLAPPKNCAHPPDFRHQPNGALDKLAVSGQ